MAERPYRKEIRVDYIGPYTAYVYADGHVETEPPQRPMSKEDVQRTRRVDVTQNRAIAMLSSERAKLGLVTANTPAAIVRQNADSVTGKILFDQFQALLHGISDVAQTATTFAGYADTLLNTVSLGGRVVGAMAGLRPEYDVPSTPVVEDESITPRDPTQPTRI